MPEPREIVSASADKLQISTNIFDVSNPAAPRQIGLLRDHGAIQTTETIHAVSAHGRKVLVETPAKFFGLDANRPITPTPQ